MNSNPKQPNHREEKVSDLLDRSALAAWLGRRGIDPVGVIDVGHVRRLHARRAGWIAVRFPLLFQLMRRQGDQEAETGGQGGFVYREGGDPPEPSRADGNPPSSLATGAMGAMPGAAAPAPWVYRADAPREPVQFRVRRNRPLPEVNTPAAGNVHDKPGLRASVAGQAPSLAPFRQRDREMGDFLRKSAPTAAGTAIPERLPARRPVPVAAAVRRPDAPPAGPPPPSRAVFAKAPGGVSSGAPAGVPAGAPDTPPAPDRLSLVAPMTARAHPLAPSMEMRGAGPPQPSGDTQSAIVVAERPWRSTPPPKPDMILRQGPRPALAAAPDSGGRQTRTGAPVRRDRQVVDSGHPAALQPAPARPAQSQAPEGKLDIGAIAEQVSRVIARQLIIERERRGGHPWG